MENQAQWKVQMISLKLLCTILTPAQAHKIAMDCYVFDCGKSGNLFGCVNEHINGRPNSDPRTPENKPSLKLQYAGQKQNRN